MLVVCECLSSGSTNRQQRSADRPEDAKTATPIRQVYLSWRPRSLWRPRAQTGRKIDPGGIPEKHEKMTEN